jgi:hypothetical protein
MAESFVHGDYRQCREIQTAEQREKPGLSGGLQIGSGVLAGTSLLSNQPQKRGIRNFRLIINCRMKKTEIKSYFVVDSEL